MKSSRQGLSLVETLISLALLGVVAVSMSMVVLKANVNAISQSYRSRGIIELDSLYRKMRSQLQNATMIDDASYQNQITFTTKDDSGNYVWVSYRLVTSGSYKILQYSPDGGTTWQSPYGIAADNSYRLSTNAEFLFCGFKNNCTRFTDNNADGAFDFWGGETAALVSGPGIAVPRPIKANKIQLTNFTFTRQVGNPPITRTWPNTIIHFPDINITPYAMEMQSFSSQDTDLFNSTFNVRSIYYDPNYRAILTVGNDSGTDYLYISNREGVPLKMPNSRINLSSFSPSDFDGVCMMSNDQAILGRLYTTPTARFLSLNLKTGRGTMFQIPLASYNLASLDSIACDPADPTYFYLYGSTTGNQYVIMQVHATQGTVSGGLLTAIMGTTWTIGPTSGGTVGEARGFFIGPVSSTGAAGDFYVLDDWVHGSPAYQTLWRIPRSAPSTQTGSYDIILEDMDSPAPAYVYGITFDPDTNHLFVSTEDTDKIHEITLPLKIVE